MKNIHEKRLRRNKHLTSVFPISMPEILKKYMLLWRPWHDMMLEEDVIMCRSAWGCHVLQYLRELLELHTTSVKLLSHLFQQVCLAVRSFSRKKIFFEASWKKRKTGDTNLNNGDSCGDYIKSSSVLFFTGAIWELCESHILTIEVLSLLCR